MTQDSNNNLRPNTSAPETNVDFSKYMGGSEESEGAPAPQDALKPEKIVPTTRSTKFIVMLVILVALAGIFTWLVLRDRKPPLKVPEGYRMVYPKNDTPRLEKINP